MGLLDCYLVGVAALALAGAAALIVSAADGSDRTRRAGARAIIVSPIWPLAAVVVVLYMALKGLAWLLRAASGRQ